MSDEPAKTLLSALLRVQAELPNISLEKKGKNPAFKSKYLELDGLHKAIIPLLNRHGLVWITQPGRAEDGTPILWYALMNANARDEQLTGAMPLMLDKQNSQGLGSAITYARRYSLCSVVGAVGDSDDDGNAASRKPPAPSEQPTKAKGWGHDTDRLLNDEEQALVVDSLTKWALKHPEKDRDMLLRGVGLDNLDAVTVAQGREIMRKTGKPAGPEASAK